MEGAVLSGKQVPPPTCQECYLALLPRAPRKLRPVGWRRPSVEDFLSRACGPQNFDPSPTLPSGGRMRVVLRTG
eukprot:3202028-Rhodomonas_salina.1